MDKNDFCTFCRFARPKPIKPVQNHKNICILATTSFSAVPLRHNYLLSKATQSPLPGESVKWPGGREQHVRKEFKYPLFATTKSVNPHNLQCNSTSLINFRGLSDELWIKWGRNAREPLQVLKTISCFDPTATHPHRHIIINDTDQ